MNLEVYSHFLYIQGVHFELIEIKTFVEKFVSNCSEDK